MDVLSLMLTGFGGAASAIVGDIISEKVSSIKEKIDKKKKASEEEAEETKEAEG